MMCSNKKPKEDQLAQRLSLMPTSSKLSAFTCCSSGVNLFPALQHSIVGQPRAALRYGTLVVSRDCAGSFDFTYTCFRTTSRPQPCISTFACIPSLNPMPIRQKIHTRVHKVSAETAGRAYSEICYRKLGCT